MELGFSPENGQVEHLGLGIMRERAADIQAALTIDSRVGQGTRVTLIWCGRSRKQIMNETKPIRVLIVDDHAMVRSGLRNFIYGFDWMEPVGEAGNGAEAVEFCAQHEVDVVLMDMIMPVMDGSEATRRIMALGKPVKIIILTSFHEQDLVEQALRAGATSYLLKNVTAEELAAAIRSAYAGQATLSPEATEALIDSTRQRHDVGFDLTEREQEVLALLAAGLSNREISETALVQYSDREISPDEYLHKIGGQESSRGRDHCFGAQASKQRQLIEVTNGDGTIRLVTG